MNKEIAETRALEVLTWVLAEDDLIQVFMDATGAVSYTHLTLPTICSV